MAHIYPRPLTREGMSFDLLYEPVTRYTLTLITGPGVFFDPRGTECFIIL